MRKTGSKMRMTTVTANSPNEMAMAMGMRNCACRLFCKSKGARPAKVVTEVSTMGRKRDTPAS